MNSDTLKGKWKQLKDDLKAHWGRLTDDDMQVIDGNIDKLVTKVEELYGETREAVHDRVQTLLKKLHAAEPMNADTLKGKWKQLKDDLKAHWGKLTDDDMQVIDGSIDKLVAKVEELYGETREAVHDRVQALLKKLHPSETQQPDEPKAPDQPPS